MGGRSAPPCHPPCLQTRSVRVVFTWKGMGVEFKGPQDL